MTGEPWWHKCKPRNAGFILIAASAAIHNPRAAGPSNLRTLSIHNPSTQPFYTTCLRQQATTPTAKPCPFAPKGRPL